MFDYLDIYVFGSGIGETIVIIFPNKKIGIIDCGNKEFIEWFKKYIEDNLLKSIEFFLWTHPHDDHSYYINNLLDLCETKQLKINYFCRFDYKPFKPIARILDFYHSEAKMLNINCNNDNKSDELSFTIISESRPNYFINLLEKIQNLKNNGIILEIDKSFKLGHIPFDLNYICPDIKIICLSPTQENIDTYQQKHEKYDYSRINYPLSEDLIKEFYLDSNLHNELSVAITMIYKNHYFIFGGDTENSAWKTLLEKERFYDYFKKNIIFLKVPHHGSKTSYLKSIWDEWGNDFKAAITPFGKKLPTEEMLNVFKQHTPHVLVVDKSLEEIFQDEPSFLISNLANNVSEEPKQNEDKKYYIKYRAYNDGNIEVDQKTI